MRGKRVFVTVFACMLAAAPLLQGNVWSLKADSSRVVAEVNGDQIVIGNDMISRTYQIDDRKHVVTSDVENKRINLDLQPAKGSADFFVNTIDQSEDVGEIVFPEKEITRNGWRAQVSTADGSSVNKNMNNILDGNDATEVDFSTGKKFPYHFQVDLGSEQAVTSFSYQKRAGNANQLWGINGTIGKYELSVSDNGTEWISAGQGEFTREDYNLHSVTKNGTTIYNVGDRVYGNFDKTYTTRYIRLTMLSGALSDDPSFTGSDFRLYEDVYQGIEKAPTTISSSDLVLKDTSIETSSTGDGKKISLMYEPYTINSVTWNFTYHTVIEPDDHFMRSYVEATADKEDQAYIDFIELDHFKLDESVQDVWTHPDYQVAEGPWNFLGYEFMLGQPIYADGMFIGSEFPATDTQVIDDTMQVRYYSGKSMAQLRDEGRLTTDGKFMTWANVIGAAQGTPSDVVQTDFYAYIDTIATQTDFRKQYNSWYDNRMAITDESISKAFYATEKGLTSIGVEPLDSYVVDDGWNNYNDPDFTGIDVARSGHEYNKTGFWEFNDKFPNELYPANDMASKFASSFGLWLGPQGGYELYSTYSKYIEKSETGYINHKAALGDVICTGSKKYINNLTNLFVDYQKRFDIDYWKLDGFSSRPCKETDHDHMAGGYHDMYFTSELWENWTDAFEAMRAQRKEEGKGLFINGTCYVNPSPWMLRWMNTIWMSNAGDLESDGTNGGTSSAKMISGRDNIYFKNYKTAQLQFPLKNVYNHDPIYGVSAGVSMTTSDFRNYMMANAVRGTAFWELYFSPSMMDESMWQVTADVLDWAQSNDHILEKAKLFGTAPNQKGVYGYSSWDKEEGIIEFRNPTSSTKTYTLKIDNIVGVSSDMKDASIMQVLPYKSAMDEGTVSYGDSITVTLAPYETRIYQYGKKDDKKPEMLSMKSMDEQTIRIRFNERMSDTANVIIAGYTISQQKLLDDYKTLEIKVNETLQDNVSVAMEVRDIAGNTYTHTENINVYEEGNIYKIQDKDDLKDAQDIREEVYSRNDMNVMHVKNAYDVETANRLEGKQDFSVSMTLQTGSRDINVLKQEGAYSIGIDSDGYLVAQIGSKQLTSKENKTLVDEKAHGLLGTEAYNPTSTKEIITGQINDGKMHTINLVREVNGMLKLYVDGALCATKYDGPEMESLANGNIQFGDAKGNVRLARIQVKDKSIGYDDAQKDYSALKLDRYATIDRSSWKADASSEYKKGTSNVEGPAKNAIDGNTGTLWHTDYSNAYPTPLDHWISFDFGKDTTFSRFSYMGRAAGTNGNIKDYVIQIKNKEGGWSDLEAGTFVDGGTNVVDFDEVTTTGIRLKGVTFYGPDPRHASAVEINVYQDMGEQPDLDALQMFIEGMGELKSKTDYTTTSYQVYKDAYENVVKMLDDINLTNVQMLKTMDLYTQADQNIVSIVILKDIVALANERIQEADAYASSYIEALKTAVHDASLLYDHGSETVIAIMVTTIQQLLDHPVISEDTTFVKGILYGAITKAEAALADETLVLAPAVQEMIEARLAIAKTIYADNNATTEEIMNAWDNLAKELQYLDFTANKKALNELITSCDGINVGDYTQGVEEYLAALDEAKTVSADENALQTRINAAYLRLLTGIEGLKASDVNKLGLKAMIDGAVNAFNNAGDYNQEDASWAVFTKAFTDAQAVFNNDKATQSEVNKAMSELAGAYENIRLLPNEDLLKALKAFIETANMMNPANYRASDVAYVRSALADAKAILAKADITEKERKDIEERIANSYNIMANNKVENVETPGDVNKTPTPEVPAQPETPKATEIKGTTKPGTTKTGDATNMAMYAILLGGAGASLMYTKKRTKK